MTPNRLFNRLKKQITLLKTIGPVSILDDILNGINVWSTHVESKQNARFLGSISGQDSGYLNIVDLALTNPKVFQKFKSNREYREILEHVDRSLGQEYLEVIKLYGSIPANLLDFCKSTYCKPFRYSYSEIGRVSPSNLRYAKVALDLKALFGDLSGYRVAEIGVGYGGQFHAISTLAKPSEYSFFDLPKVIDLATLYISRFVNESSSRISDGSHNTDKAFDLVISNYAFSELERKIQEEYFEKVILKSIRGYMIYNDIGNSLFDSMKFQEVLERIPGSIMVPENPISHPKNKLVIWGHASTDLLQL